MGVTYHWGAMSDAIRAERGRRRWSQAHLGKLAGGVSQGTIKNIESGRTYKAPPFTLMQAIDAAFEWEPGRLENLLRYGTDPTDEMLEERYRREAVPEGKLVGLVEDMIYEAFVAAAPGTPIAEIDKARRAAFDVLRRNGIEVALKHPETDSGTDTEA